MSNLSKNTRILLFILAIITIISFGVAYIYYNSRNKAEDPRIVATKYMFKQFDELLAEGKFDSIFPILDTIESILTRVPGYRMSYEPGIVYNNRGSAFLSKALYEVKDSVEQQKLLEFAEKNLDSAIAIYQTWLKKYENLDRNRLIEEIKPYFLPDDPAFTSLNSEAILDKRVEEVMLAQKETKRRLSVSYTNLGIVQRHRYKQEEAAQSYITAITLWKDNYTARNNFNVLMGKPPEDRSIIDQLFPPDKNKAD